MPVRKKIGELLVEAGVVKEADVRQALGHQKAMGGGTRLGEMLVSTNGVSQTAIARALATQFDLPFVQLPEISLRVAETVPLAFQSEHKIVPFRIEQEGKSERLHLAVADPGNLDVVDELRFNLRKTLRIYVAALDDIENALSVLKGERVEELQPISIDEDATELQVERSSTNMVVGSWFGPTPDSASQSQEVDIDIEPTPPQPTPAPARTSSASSSAVSSVAAPPTTGSAQTPAVPSAASTGGGTSTSNSDASQRPSASAPRPPPSEAVRHAAADILDDLLGGMEAKAAPAAPAASSRPAPVQGVAIIHKFTARKDDPKEKFEFSDSDLHILDNLERLATGQEAVLEGEKVRPERMVAALIRLLIRKGVMQELEFLEELTRK